MTIVTEDDVVLARSFGLDISANALQALSEKQKNERLATFYSRVAAMEYPGFSSVQDMHEPYLSPPPLAILESKPSFKVVPEELIASGKRDSFKQALEDAFWALGGVHYLVEMGKVAPLEFLKVCSKLTNVEEKAKGNGIKFVMEFAKPELEHVKTNENEFEIEEAENEEDNLENKF